MCCCMPTCESLCVCAHLCVFVYVYLCLHVCVLFYVFEFVCLWMCKLECVFLCLCWCTSVCVFCVYLFDYAFVCMSWCMCMCVWKIVTHFIMYIVPPTWSHAPFLYATSNMVSHAFCSRDCPSYIYNNGYIQLNLSMSWTIN